MSDILKRLIDLLGRTRFVVDDEKRLQASIADAFVAASFDFEREVRLSPEDVIDFVVGRVGIEVKTKGGKRAIYRQLERYAEADQIDAMILISAVAMGMPAAIKGKPVEFVSLGRSWL